MINLYFLLSQDVYLNGKLVSDSDACYAYKAHILTTMLTTREAKKTYLITQGTFPDHYPSTSDEVIIRDNTDADKEMKARYEWLRLSMDSENQPLPTDKVSSSKTVDVSCQPMQSILAVNKVLPPGTEIRLVICCN